MRAFRHLKFFLFSLGVILALGSPIEGQMVCGDYGGCDLVILKVRGTITDGGGTPITTAVATGTENRLRNINVVEFFAYCEGDLHVAQMVASSTSLSSEIQNPGFYELLFIVCAEDKGDFAADFDVCIQAPGFEPACMVATFDDGDDREGLDFTLVPSPKISPVVGGSDEKGLPPGDCGDYDHCAMALLKVRGSVQDASGIALNNAEVTGVLTQIDNVNAIQFYEHCGDGRHTLHTKEVSLSGSGTSQEDGSFELLFSVCVEDSNDVLPDEFDVDLNICASAPGFQGQCLPVNFNEDDDRDDRTFMLVPIVGVPTATPTSSPTETTTATVAPTAENPAADINNDGVINHKDTLILLENWLRIVEPQ